MSDSLLRAKILMYLLFFFLAQVVAIMVVDNFKISNERAWIPFVGSTAIVTLLILIFDAGETSLRSVIFAALSATLGGVFFPVVGTFSPVFLGFQGLASLLGLGVSTASVATAASFAAVAAPITIAIAADPAAAMGSPAGVGIIREFPPLPESPRARASSIDWMEEGGRRRHRRGGRKFLWKW